MGITRSRTSRRRGPSGARIFLAAIVLGAASTARADVLTEADVVRLARAVDPAARAADAEAELASARARGEGLHRNPILTWERQQIRGDGPNAQAQDEVVVAVPIGVSRERVANRDIARVEASIAAASAARESSDAAERALLAYHAAIAANERVAILERAALRLREAARVLAARVAEGVTPGFEAARVDVEVALAESAVREARVVAEAALEELAARIGTDAPAIELPPRIERVTVVPASADLDPERPSNARMRDASRAAASARRRARRAAIPDLVVSGGLFVGSLERTELGYSVGAAAEIPIVSRGQHLRAASGAAARLATARAEAADRERAIAARRAHRELAFAVDELARFEAAVSERIELLERSVATGLREGRRTVLEGIDVERARTSVEERRLALALAAKQAEVRLRAARGELE